MIEYTEEELQKVLEEFVAKGILKEEWSEEKQDLVYSAVKKTTDKADYTNKEVTK